MDELNEIKNSHNIGDEMTITVNRNGEQKDLTITLGEQPQLNFNINKTLI